MYCRCRHGARLVTSRPSPPVPARARPCTAASHSAERKIHNYRALFMCIVIYFFIYALSKCNNRSVKCWICILNCRDYYLLYLYFTLHIITYVLYQLNCHGLPNSSLLISQLNISYYTMLSNR